jgi:hypothetical protein
MPDFGFVGESYTARSIYQDDQEAINWYCEIDKDRGQDERGVKALYPTPGLTLITQLADQAEVRGAYTISGSTQMMTVCGASVYVLNTAFVPTLVGTLNTNSGPVSIVDNGTFVMITDGATRYAYNIATGYFTSLAAPTFTASIASGGVMTVTAMTSGLIGLNQVVTDVLANVPAATTVTAQLTQTGTLGPGTTGTYQLQITPSTTVVSSETMNTGDGAFTGGSQVSEMDTFFIYTNLGSNEFGASNAGSAASQPLSFSFKDGAADFLVTDICVNRELFLLGEKTGECWTDQGLFPFPFLRLPGTNIQHGCAAVFSVARVGESFAWLSKDDRGQGLVYQMNGYVPVKISTPAMEAQIALYSIISDARAFSYQQAGHEFYQLTFPSADVTWVYDSTTQLWHKRAWRDTYNVFHRHRGNCACVFSNKVVVGDWQNGNLYYYDLTNYSDNGVPLICLRRAPHLTVNLQRVTYLALQLQFQPGVGLVSGQGSNPQAMLRWSDDGGSTWSNEHWRSIGTEGAYKNRCVWRQLGQARDRIFEVRVSDPVFRVIVSCELNAEIDDDDGI